MRFGSACALVLGALAFAPEVHAAPETPQNVATARELFKQGADALDVGDAKTAEEKLSAAWALAQTPVIGASLARAHLALGQLVEAREAALAVARLPPTPNETTRSAQARTEAEGLALQIAPRIPHVKIAIEGLADHEATIKLDGVIVPQAALSVSRQTNPGNHTGTVDTDDGRHAEGTITLGERETKDLILTLGAPTAPRVTEPAVVPPTKTVPPPVIAPPPPTSSTSPLVWVGIATTGIGVAVGAVTGAFALSEASTVKSHCVNVSPTDSQFVCGPSYTGDLSSARTMATVSTVGFIVGGVGVVVLITGLILSGKKHETPAAQAVRVVPMIGPISGVSGTF